MKGDPQKGDKAGSDEGRPAEGDKADPMKGDKAGSDEGRKCQGVAEKQAELQPPTKDVARN